MKLWKIMADVKPGISSEDLKHMMLSVADGCGAQGKAMYTIVRGITRIAFVIADDHVTAKDLQDAWRFECKVRTGNADDPACVVTMISRDTDPETLARYYGMIEDRARKMLNDAYPAALPKEEAERRGAIGLEFKVEVQGVEQASAHLKELCDLLEKAQALTAGLNETLGGLEITVERV